MSAIGKFVCNWEVIYKRLSHLGRNVLAAIYGMSAIWDADTGMFHCISDNFSPPILTLFLWIIFT